MDNRTKTITAIIAVALIVVAGGILIARNNGNTPAPSPSPSPTPSELMPTITPSMSPTPTSSPLVSPSVSASPSKTPTPSPVAQVKEFTVTAATNFTFAPSTITVKKGDTVKITLKNSGGTHDLKIDELGIATKQIGSGLTDVIQFVATKTGTFEYYCSVGNHRAMGMKGTLIVQ